MTTVGTRRGKRSLHKGLSEPDDPPDLSTPRASLINMLRAAQDGDFERAAWSLNLQGIPQEQNRPAHLAKLFYYVLTQTVQIDYRSRPDRPNGGSRHQGWVTIESAGCKFREWQSSVQHFSGRCADAVGLCRNPSRASQTR